ncbi:MAG: sugar transferase, partial [Maribacter dokdonensis]
GVNKNTFWCYKFRSMTKSDDSDTKMATKNDMRVTKLGKILRKTSIDELPQFFNVLKGDMSIVGPRPHMEVHTKQYETSVEKYLVRHFLKPGITGLAQVKGYRGEIIRKSDIVNRVRYDIFYMEKWSILLDIQIIILTITNVFSNEEKAY